MPKILGFRVEYVGVDKITPATRTAKRSTEELATSGKRLKTSFAGVTGVMRQAMPFLAGAASIAGIYKLASGIFQTSVGFEKMQFQLRGVSRTIQEADAQFQMIRKFAYDTPHMTEDVTQAFIMLKAVGLSPTLREMEIFGNAAFAMGRNITDVASSIIALETEVLRRLGIQLDRTGKKAVIVSGDMRVEVENDLDVIRRAVIDVWEKRFPGAMDKAAETTIGSIAIMKSAWAEFEDSLGTLVLQPITKVIKKMTELTELALKMTREFKIEMGIKIPEREYLETRIKSIREEIEGLEKIVTDESKWSKLNKLFMTAGAEEEAKERLSDLRAELRLYQQQLDSINEAEKRNIDVKNLAAEAEKRRIAATEAAREAAEKEMAGLTHLGEKYKSTYQSIGEAMLLGVSAGIPLLESLNEQRDAHAAYLEWLGEKYQSTYESIGEAMLTGATMGKLAIEDLGASHEIFAETVEGTMARAEDALASTIGAMVHGTIAWKSALSSLLSSLVSFLVKQGIKKVKEMWASSAEQTAKAAEAIAEYDYAGAVMHALAASGFITAGTAWGQVKHRGGMVEPVSRTLRGLRSDEVPIIAQVGEGYLSRRGVAAIGGPAAVEMANRGVSIGSQSIIMTNTMGPINNMADVERIGELLAEKILSTARESV